MAVEPVGGRGRSIITRFQPSWLISAGSAAHSLGRAASVVWTVMCRIVFPIRPVSDITPPPGGRVRDILPGPVWFAWTNRDALRLSWFVACVTDEEDMRGGPPSTASSLRCMPATELVGNGSSPLRWLPSLVCAATTMPLLTAPPYTLPARGSSYGAGRGRTGRLVACLLCRSSPGWITAGLPNRHAAFVCASVTPARRRFGRLFIAAHLFTSATPVTFIPLRTTTRAAITYYRAAPAFPTSAVLLRPALSPRCRRCIPRRHFTAPRHRHLPAAAAYLLAAFTLQPRVVRHISDSVCYICDYAGAAARRDHAQPGDAVVLFVRDATQCAASHHVLLACLSRAEQRS